MSTLQRIMFFLLSLSLPMSAQTHISAAQSLSELHDQVKVSGITSRRFTQLQLAGWIAPAIDAGTVRTERVGSSAEGRPITLYTYGTGSVRVLLWSQMHGDEPTATMAMADMMALFRSHPDHPAVRLIRDRLTVLMIPMLNPDGAERFTRRTAQRIDMNRDALRLESPEARTLKSVRDQFAPEFGFNLHDQDPRYTVGFTRRMTGIALLAPPVDESRTDNEVRKRAKHVAAGIAVTLHELIPGAIAKWDDAFEPRAFGDNIQRWGTSTVLIESGGWPGDKEKMHLRKMNFVALVEALRLIADGSWSTTPLDAYESLPFNMKLGCDILITNAQIRPSLAAPPARVDVAVNVDETSENGEPTTVKATIIDVGDLSLFTGYEVIDAKGAEVDSLLVKVDKVLTPEQLKSLIPRK
ncbi:MAG: M14 family zinc carboxypeptidase [Bacteroidota bacterium]